MRETVENWAGKPLKRLASFANASTPWLKPGANESYVTSGFVSYPSVRRIFGLILLLLCLALIPLARAATFQEDFSANPQTSGWRVFGETNLFYWNSTNRNLEVTWDSSRSNSYFRRPLGTVLGKQDDFSLSFALLIKDIAIGVDPEKPYTFELAVGFHNSLNASQASFVRGTGSNSANLVEFNYFPDDGYGPTVWPAFVATNGGWNYYPDCYTIFELPTNVWLDIAMNYQAATRTLTTRVTGRDQPLGMTNVTILTASFKDYRVDMFSVTSYSGRNGGGSLLAHGVVDDIQLTVPDPPIRDFSVLPAAGQWSARLHAATNWLFWLEGTTDFRSWQTVSAVAGGTGGEITLTPTNPAAPARFFRVGAARP